ncbi:hormogonium polysaccharide biosynthesis glycosyltransferase HpsP [Leptolyngbya sp. AN02str]|uniref:hormogonium polysaccharide biosynthesis glycosyltransferase HpsP n=1 Tax=Leptolyngbya sp. AN02str TaxID=3423363 RepID=UPI003D310D9E
MTSLRILHIVPSVARVYGGPSEAAVNLCAALAAQGMQVTLLTTNANGDRGQPPLPAPLNQAIAQDGYEIRYFRCQPFRRYKFSPGLLHWLWHHASEFDVAHIHALFSPVSTAAAMIARSRGVPYLLRPLGTLDPADLQKKRWLKDLYGRVLERGNLAAAAAIHFTSDREAQVSERFGAITRDLVLPLGVTSAPFPSTPDLSLIPTRPSGTPIVLFLARIDRKKGLELLIPALEQLQAQDVPFHWVVAGANPQDSAYEQQMRDRIQQSPLQTQTTLLGFVTGDRKAQLLQQADVFVLPSHYENFGLAVAEAMLSHTPVVISDQVSIANAVQQAEAGWVVPCTVKALVEALAHALHHPAERERRGRNAHALAQTAYNWSAIAQQLIQVYRQIVHEG